MNYDEKINQLAVMSKSNHDGLVSQNDMFSDFLTSFAVPIASDVNAIKGDVQALKDSYAAMNMSPAHLRELSKKRGERVNQLLEGYDYDVYGGDMHRALTGCIKKCNVYVEGFEYGGSYDRTLDKYFDAMLRFICTWVPVGGVSHFVKECDKKITRSDVENYASRYNKYHNDKATVIFGAANER